MPNAPPQPIAFEPDALKQPHFGKLLRELRLERGWRTYREAREASGVRESVWCAAEAGADIRLSTVARVLAALVSEEVSSGDGPEPGARPRDD